MGRGVDNSDGPARAEGQDRRRCASTVAAAVRIMLVCAAGCLVGVTPIARAQDEVKGGIRGTIYDAEYNVPVPEVKVSVTEAGQATATSDDGQYALPNLAPGIYTVVFAKEGYRRETRINVLVPPGAFAEVDTRLSGEYTDMDELVVSDIDLGGGSENGLLNIRQQSATMMDAVSSDMIGRAQRSTAADAIKLVAGASVEGGKYAVIRGLGDRYTSTQINAVRLPSADPDKRAVQLDQFPSAVIESLQVSKTFLPDQQGDSGGGTINIVTRSVPEERVLSFKVGTSYKPGITGNSDFRWNPRGMDYWGESDRDLLVRSASIGTMIADKDLSAALTRSLDTRVSTTTEAPPVDSSWGVTAGDVFKLGEEWRAGGLGAFSYSQKYEGHNNGIEDKAAQPFDASVKLPMQDLPGYPQTEAVGVEKILWGGVATIGIRKADEQDVGLTFLGNHAADSYAQEYVSKTMETYPSTGYKEILDYLERDFDTMQEHGRNTLPLFENWNAIPDVLSLQAPVVEWTFAQSDSYFYEPDRTVTTALHNDVEDFWKDPQCVRSWTTIDEQSKQYFLNLKEPFENWTGDKGYLKGGYFHDDVSRTFTTDYLTYQYKEPRNLLNPYGIDYGSSPTSTGTTPIWDPLYTYYLGNLGAPDAYGTLVSQGTVVGSQPPIDYTGEQRIRAWYLTGDLPTFSWLHTLGGVRTETTSMKTHLQLDTTAPASDRDAHLIYTYTPVELPADRGGGRVIGINSSLHDDEAGADLEHLDVLPALGFVVKPFPEMQLRLNWSQTIARPTFKELTPVATPIQGTSDYFIGNKDLGMSSMNNYDSRLELYPGAGNLIAFSAFLKHIENPIDRVLVQLSEGSAYLPLNYPEATLKGMEAELRQQLGAWWRTLDGFNVGANGTVLQSKLMYDQATAQGFSQWSGKQSRPMTGQPNYLANLNAGYDMEPWGLSLNVFYTFQGNTLVSGESATSDNYTPNVYQKPVGTLSTSISKTLHKNWKLTLGAKNILRAAVTQYYDDGTRMLRTRYTTPIEYTFGLEGKW